MVSTRSSDFDAVVVGARVAGAATALLLARAGLRVLAIDRDTRGTDTLSTHALMRAGVLQLHRWGLLDAVRAAGTPAIRRTCFHYGDEVVEVPIVARNGLDALFAPRRTVIDPILVSAAEAAGARVDYGVRLVDLERAENGRVRGLVTERRGREERITAGIVIGADGARSTVARLAGAGVERQLAHAAGTIYGYWRDLPFDGYQWFFGPGVSAGVIPTNDGAFCVSMTMPGRRFRREARGGDGLARTFRTVAGEVSPLLARVLGAGEPVGGLRGFPGEPAYLRRSAGPGWALVGDAGYFKDPITAHGISDALRDAELLARAVIEDDKDSLTRYQRIRDALSIDVMDVTDRIASFDWSIDEVRRLHRAFSDAMKAEMRHLEGLPSDMTEESSPVVNVPAAGVSS